MTDLVAKVANAISDDLCIQEGVEDYPLGDNLTVDWLDQGETNLGQTARAAIAAMLDHIEERANIAQRVRDAIGATQSQQVALAYAEAKLRSMLATMRREALGEQLPTEEG